MNPTVLITGATKGIGRACAEHFATRGYDVTAVARNANDLKKMAECWVEDYSRAQLLPHPADLSTLEGVDSVPVAPYDVVILNAAAYAPGHLLDPAADHFSELLHLNVLGNHRLARRLFAEHPPRHLVVIGSTGTDHWGAHMTAYVATKYALRGLFLGWQAELTDSQTRCTLVAPGSTLTASWVGETPPANILRPETVAAAVYRAVLLGLEGRITVPNAPATR